MSASRRLLLTVLALLLSGLGLWASSRLVWLRLSYDSPLRGPGTVQALGAELRPELVGVALLAVAAAAAVVATRGAGRRAVGMLVAAAGVWAVWSSVAVWAGGAGAGGRVIGTGLPTDAMPVGPPGRTAAPALAVGSGLLLVASAAATMLWANTMAGMGRRYASSTAVRRRADPDSEWWNALNAGEDPTVDASRPTLGQRRDDA